MTRRDRWFVERMSAIGDGLKNRAPVITRLEVATEEEAHQLAQNYDPFFGSTVVIKVSELSE